VEVEMRPVEVRDERRPNDRLYSRLEISIQLEPLRILDDDAGYRQVSQELSSAWRFGTSKLKGVLPKKSRTRFERHVQQNLRRVREERNVPWRFQTLGFLL